jgi:hypothetical protein
MASYHVAVPSRPHSASGKGSTAVSVSIDDFTAADREKTLSLLLSQDRVITLLYAKVPQLPQPHMPYRFQECRTTDSLSFS